MNVRDFYQQNGYYVHDTAHVDVGRVTAARQAMDQLMAGEYDTGIPPEPSPWNPGDDPHTLCKIEQPQKASRAIAQLIGSPELGLCIAAATGAEMVQVWWVQLLYKPPTTQGVATKVGWHQDWTYWHQTWEESSELLTAWISVSDVVEESGPMKFIPGSHQWKNVGGGDFFNQGIDKSSFAIPEGQTWREVPAVMPAGGLSLHHKHTIHGSSQNTSEAPRCSFAVHLRTDKSRPLDGGRAGHARFIDDYSVCPIIYGKRVETAYS